MPATTEGISPQFLSRCLADLVDEETVILDETVTNTLAVREQLPRPRAATYFASGGSALRDNTTGSKNVSVAVLDSGVASSAEDLAGRMDSGYDFVRDRVEISKPETHGASILSLVFFSINMRTQGFSVQDMLLNSILTAEVYAGGRSAGSPRSACAPSETEELRW